MQDCSSRLHTNAAGEQYEAKNKFGAVASERAVCSNIGIDMIKDGGKAADAVCWK